MRMTSKTSLSSLYEIPIDKPIGIDLSKFLQSNDTINYEGGNDIDIIQEAMK